MLKNILLLNFKGFKTVKNLEFKPITVLCGVNSSGKSSILKSILLMKQSIESLSKDSPLLLNGKCVKLGSFEDIIYNHDTNNSLSMSFTFNFADLSNKLEKYKYDIMIKDFLGIDSRDKKQKATFTISFKQIDSEIIVSEFVVEGFNLHIRLSHINDNKYLLDCNNIYIPAKDSGKKGLNLSEEVELKFGNSLIPRIRPISNKDKISSNVTKMRFADFMCHYSGTILQILLEQISYIGPLRKEPARRYIYEDEVSSIGPRGENAAYIYSKEKENNEKNNSFNIQECKFYTALNKWLSQMNINEFNNNTQKEIIRLNVKSSSGVKVDISDVGFGVSQILPILIEGLRMGDGQTLLLEQPEIHLHPKLQMQLTDFFIAMSLNDKNTIIETHSEHIINRLVRRSLEDDDIREKINIYFINSEGLFEKIIIDKGKGITNWPVDFFDQAVDEQREILKLTISNSRK